MREVLGRSELLAGSMCVPGTEAGTRRAGNGGYGEELMCRDEGEAVR